jgi:hypothetical protein
MNVSKMLNINAREIKVTGRVVRVATQADKEASRLYDNFRYYIVDFDWNGVSYRGIWRAVSCEVELELV